MRCKISPPHPQLSGQVDTELSRQRIAVREITSESEDGEEEEEARCKSLRGEKENFREN